MGITIVGADVERRIAEAEAYLAARTGCYEFRCQRYDAALEAMHGLGLDDACTVVDVGSGWGEFGARMHTGNRQYVSSCAACYDGAAPPCGPHHGSEMGMRWEGLMPSRARYIPVDAAIDGTDLEHWRPREADYFVCLEVLEHLRRPARLLAEMIAYARRGVIVSTPNPQTTDVLGMDPTHQTPVERALLEGLGMHVEAAAFYGQPADSLFAVYSPRLP